MLQLVTASDGSESVVMLLLCSITSPASTHRLHYLKERTQSACTVRSIIGYPGTTGAGAAAAGINRNFTALREKLRLAESELDDLLGFVVSLELKRDSLYKSLQASYERVKAELKSDQKLYYSEIVHDAKATSDAAGVDASECFPSDDYEVRMVIRNLTKDTCYPVRDVQRLVRQGYEIEDRINEESDGTEDLGKKIEECNKKNIRAETQCYDQLSTKIDGISQKLGEFKKSQDEIYETMERIVGDLPSKCDTNSVVESGRQTFRSKATEMANEIKYCVEQTIINSNTQVLSQKKGD